MWFDIDASLSCVQTWFQRRANVTFAVGVHVVSAAPLDSRIYVMCGLCFVMFQSLFFLFVFVQFFQFIQFHSCRDFCGLRCKSSHSHHDSTQFSVSDVRAGGQVFLSRCLEDLYSTSPRVSGRGGWWHLGKTCLFILFLVGKHVIKSRIWILPTQMGLMVDKPELCLVTVQLIMPMACPIWGHEKFLRV